MWTYGALVVQLLKDLQWNYAAVNKHLDKMYLFIIFIIFNLIITFDNLSRFIGE